MSAHPLLRCYWYNGVMTTGASALEVARRFGRAMRLSPWLRQRIWQDLAPSPLCPPGHAFSTPLHAGWIPRCRPRRGCSACAGGLLSSSKTLSKQRGSSAGGGTRGSGGHSRGRAGCCSQCTLHGLSFRARSFYFCYPQGEARYLRPGVKPPWTRVHITCWTGGAGAPDKTFHVSVMGLAMRYHWRIRPPEQETLIHIESHPQSGEAKLFDATLALSREPLSRKGLMALLARWPWMTLKVLLGIYWQALRLFIKRTPIFSHPETR